MLKYIKFGFFAVLVGSAFAAPVSSIGVIDVKSIMQQSSRIKHESNQLKERFSSQTKEIESLRKELAADISNLRKNGSIMSKEDKATLEKKLTEKQTALQKKQMALSKKIMAAQKEVITKVQSDFENIAKKCAEKNNLSLVLDQNGQVLYVLPKYDLTTQAKKQFK
jgi:Skp family chaperone for outer membrane proteins